MAYTQVKISVGFELARDFKSACGAANVSMTSVLAEYMSGYVNARSVSKTPPEYTTRRRRRLAVAGIVKQLEKIRSYEERYRDSIPANLQGSSVYENADDSVSALDESLESLASAY